MTELRNIGLKLGGADAKAGNGLRVEVRGGGYRYYLLLYESDIIKFIPPTKRKGPRVKTKRGTYELAPSAYRTASEKYG